MYTVCLCIFAIIYVHSLGPKLTPSCLIAETLEKCTYMIAGAFRHLAHVDVEELGTLGQFFRLAQHHSSKRTG